MIEVKAVPNELIIAVSPPDKAVITAEIAVPNAVNTIETPSPCVPNSASPAATRAIAAPSAKKFCGGTRAIACPNPLNAVASPVPIPFAAVDTPLPRLSTILGTPLNALLIPVPMPFAAFPIPLPAESITFEIPVKIFSIVLFAPAALPVKSSKLCVAPLPKLLNGLKDFNDLNTSNPFAASLIALIEPAIAKNP